MKLLIQTLLIFFGTLFAAAVVALGEPADDAKGTPTPVTVVASWLGLR